MLCTLRHFWRDETGKVCLDLYMCEGSYAAKTLAQHLKMVNNSIRVTVISRTGVMLYCSRTRNLNTPPVRSYH